MRILSLDPFLTELVIYYGLGASLVGCTHDCELPEDLAHLPRVTSDRGEQCPEISSRALLWDQILAVKPEIFLCSAWDLTLEEQDLLTNRRTQALTWLTTKLGTSPKLEYFVPRTLDLLYGTFERLGAVLKTPEAGRDLAQRVKAQVLNWSDNFYERMKNKRVTFLASVLPLRLAGFWIPDMIKLCSAQSQLANSGSEDMEVTWADVEKFRPDVIFVAPRDYAMADTLKTFKILEKQPNWEEIPAVKRGEVIFTEGKKNFYFPGPELISGMGLLVSAIAGFESGYITPRDSFYRLRWLELQRHKL